MAQLSSFARHLLPLRHSTGYFFAHHPCSQEHLTSVASVAGTYSRGHAGLGLSDCTASRHQPASYHNVHTSCHILHCPSSTPPHQHAGLLNNHWPLSSHSPPLVQICCTAGQKHLHSFHWQRQVNTGGARKVIEQQEQDEQEQAQLKAKQTKFDRSLGSRKAKTAEHQSVIAHMSDVRTPRSLLSKSAQQKWEVSCKTSVNNAAITAPHFIS